MFCIGPRAPGINVLGNVKKLDLKTLEILLDDKDNRAKTTFQSLPNLQSLSCDHFISGFVHGSKVNFDDTFFTEGIQEAIYSLRHCYNLQSIQFSKLYTRGADERYPSPINNNYIPTHIAALEALVRSAPRLTSLALWDFHIDSQNFSLDITEYLWLLLGKFRHLEILNILNVWSLPRCRKAIPSSMFAAARELSFAMFLLYKEKKAKADLVNNGQLQGYAYKADFFVKIVLV